MNETAVMQTRLLTRQEVADWLGVCVRTVGRMVRSGKLPVYRFGAHPRFLDHEVRAAVARGLGHPPEPRGMHARDDG